MGKFVAVVDDHIILPARVGLPHGQERFLRQIGGQVSAAVDVSLVLDTGSKRSALAPGIIDHLNPIVAENVRVETSAAAMVTTLSWVRLEFPHTSLASIPQILVARMSLPPLLQRFHGLIGRDLLKRWESFFYEGRRGRYTLRDSAGLFGWLRL